MHSHTEAVGGKQERNRTIKGLRSERFAEILCPQRRPPHKEGRPEGRSQLVGRFSHRCRRHRSAASPSPRGHRPQCLQRRKGQQRHPEPRQPGQQRTNSSCYPPSWPNGISGSEAALASRSQQHSDIAHTLPRRASCFPVYGFYHGSTPTTPYLEDSACNF
jgi:hypothetical protein